MNNTQPGPEFPSEQLARAVELRARGELEPSRQLLLELVETHPEHAEALYHCAWAHDCMGLEQEAAPFYERALAHGLSGESRHGALLGLGSTYRCLGRPDQSEALLSQAIHEFPEQRVVRAFRALALHDQGKHGDALAEMLELLLDTSEDATVQRYQRALRGYAEELKDRDSGGVAEPARA